MTSVEIRQSFLDFFKSKQHTIVPSSSLMPDSPNLLFTNAGMNQFVPIFLGQRAPDVSKWAGAIPGSDTRAADTQKCIRAGGKHNDLEDVGLDTYHHTFFEMLGNWSFGDYFKMEAIEWAWELVVGIWKFPPQRLYATVYCPFMGEKGWEGKWRAEIRYALEVVQKGAKVWGPDRAPDVADNGIAAADQLAAQYWVECFLSVGLEPLVHIVPGNKKDNFWMMGETGPCGPCSELHVDLSPQGDTEGRFVNKGDARCIEIWNLVFIQFNANPDGTFSPLPAKHVDTGMGFERVTGIMQNTRKFTDFTRVISNYETDIFRPIFDKIEKLSGKKYGSTLPEQGRPAQGGDPVLAYAKDLRVQPDIAFRVIADHIRTLSFAIADGIQPGNTDRNYVLRRILRRAVRYGRTLGFHEPFFYKLVSVVADTMGHVFPELRAKQDRIEQVIQREEEAFNKTLDGGIKIFDQLATAEAGLSRVAEGGSSFVARLERSEVHRLAVPFQLQSIAFEIDKVVRNAESGLWDRTASQGKKALADWVLKIKAAQQKANEGLSSRFNPELPAVYVEGEVEALSAELASLLSRISPEIDMISGAAAFLLYDEKGFPLDLTELMARERGLTVDVAGFNKLMDEQKARARAAQKKQVIELSQLETATPTQFVGYDKLEAPAKVLEVVGVKDKTAVILDSSPLYAEMGGQVGDTGELRAGGQLWPVTNTQKTGNTWLHFLGADNLKLEALPDIGSMVTLAVDENRRRGIERHHTVTHLLHWALHEVVSPDATQKGSYVGPEKLTFDFSSAPLTPQQVADVERLVNERILENAFVSWTEVGYADVKARPDIMQFFGDKYGDRVRMVQVGGKAAALDGYSMELCGGTHTRATGEIGLFRIVGESAIAAGIRRIEAVSGLEAYKRANEELQLIKTVAGKVNSPVGELEKKIEALLAHQKDLEKQLKGMQQQQAAETARGLVAKAQTFGSTPAIVENLGAADGDFLQSVADALKGQFKGVVVLGGAANSAVSLVATVAPELTKKIQAGKIIQAIAPIVGGKGGGRPDNARGGGKDVGKLNEALAKVKSLLI
jgi:alanyl-tRNA synthetase